MRELEDFRGGRAQRTMLRNARINPTDKSGGLYHQEILGQKSEVKKSNYEITNYKLQLIPNSQFPIPISKYVEFDLTIVPPTEKKGKFLQILLAAESRSVLIRKLNCTDNPQLI